MRSATRNRRSHCPDKFSAACKSRVLPSAQPSTRVLSHYRPAEDGIRRSLIGIVVLLDKALSTAGPVVSHI
jgi:hypothetical protein